jgi:hypothetical protein
VSMPPPSARVSGGGLVSWDVATLSCRGRFPGLDDVAVFVHLRLRLGWVGDFGGICGCGDEGNALRILFIPLVVGGK